MNKYFVSYVYYFDDAEDDVRNFDNDVFETEGVLSSKRDITRLERVISKNISDNAEEFFPHIQYFDDLLVIVKILNFQKIGE